MNISSSTPAAGQLPAVADLLTAWQADPWAGHLHPGDLGWHSYVGAGQTASDLRVWERDGEHFALGMLDGSQVLRLAVDPRASNDRGLAEHFVNVLARQATELLGDDAVVEVRGALALREALLADGWGEDEPWTPMTLDLSGPLDLGRLHSSRLRIVEVGPEAAADWTRVHWSSFKGTPLDDETHSRFVDRWTQIMTGPFADRAHSLIGYDADSVPVAVTTVWTAAKGRPGLVEPMGVDRQHHGKGYATAITLAGAEALQNAGSSSAVVVAENSNPAALATYRSAGFAPQGQVTDLRYP